ncbi:hypothetical protein LSTR_LSTR012633 [Laodelphax striatellus]|uniref:Uncharacterized protein n=1 Tax=Laodelphax striatellus TaxID=195883 RepID=A0A482X8Z2_LAOST|nr:hypothetical protein LSTR_LSTR012633 [Laodelphax striatellus]
MVRLNLGGFLQSVAGNSTDVDVDKKALMNLLSLLPRNPSPTPTPTHHTTNGQAKKSTASAKGSSYKSDALDEGLGGEEEVNKPVLVIPFDTNANPSVLEMQKKGILVDDLVRVGIEGGGVVMTGGAINGLDQEPEGRDTPSSQMTEGDDVTGPPGGGGGGGVGGGGGGRGGPVEGVAGGAQAGGGGGGGGGNKQQCRFDIDEKFGKFQIKKLMEGRHFTQIL